MEVEVPVQGFHFNSKTKTSYMSSSFSSSPRRFEFQRHSSTAPTSPTASTAVGSSCLSPTHITEDEDNDFAFDFSGHLDKNAPPPELTTADELFYKGKIRPLKLPLRLCSPAANHIITAKHSDPFSASMAEPTRDCRSRGRAPSLSSRSRKGSRSLSPLRKETNPSNPFPISCKTEEESSNSGKKWCFKDLLLFRSASEGRATGDKNKDPLRKYTAACLSPKGRKGSLGDESRSSSFRLPSPHAMHYAANRAAAEELKRKTALPYKRTFLNWLRFAPALRSLGSLGAGDNHSSYRGKAMAGSKSMPPLRDGS
ncbi:uncharacterized protein LOC110030533 [Phalaenopsis equestris]|uniref:uncharacterized protein LOC110030533 n=1 Tax=Phalaenopsis equestris TaxID=78828 RepID=UPI0009E5AC1B|nr:uncharacterized protein LOC110030533 [Phalaenopsis equestris]